MSRNYRILLVKACGMAKEEEELNGIINFVKLMDFDHHIISPKNLTELYQEIKINGVFDFVYFSSHGNELGFSNENGTITDSWGNFSYNLCMSGCLANGCMILLSCCRGGLVSVAYNLFFACNQISYIIGVKQSLTPYEMVTGFTVFLFNVVVRNLDPVLASSKISKATDLRFIGFDYKEIVETLEYKTFTKSIINDLDIVYLKSGSNLMQVVAIDNIGAIITTEYMIDGIIEKQDFKSIELSVLQEGSMVSKVRSNKKFTVTEINYQEKTISCSIFSDGKRKLKTFSMNALKANN